MTFESISSYTQIYDCQNARRQKDIYGRPSIACLPTTGCLNLTTLLVLRRLQTEVHF